MSANDIMVIWKSIVVLEREDCQIPFDQKLVLFPHKKLVPPPEKKTIATTDSVQGQQQDTEEEKTGSWCAII